MTDINKLRNQIDEIDSQLTELFQKRMETVEKVAEYKKLNGISTNDPSREQKIIEKHLPEVEEKWQPYYRDFQEELFVLSKKYQDTKNRNDDPFIRYGMDFSEYRDAAFNASQNARKAMARNPETVNGTVGSLCGDDGTIIAFDSVYDAYDKVPNKRKASYAGGIQGNPDFNETVFSWLNRLDNIRIPHRNVATPGGTGAISLAVTNLLDKHETLLILSIAWGSYRVMAGQHDLKVDTYEIFENNEVSINGMKRKCAEMME
ncbi:MAG: chorismate mutase, partial [Erysipelotrichaceae bacterium]|nr:chorismate mutase [Erysipelotrichaceae bacterium]